MLRVNVILTETGEFDVEYENATVMSNDDVVLDSVSYDIIMNELEMLRETVEEYEHTRKETLKFLESLEQLPKWLHKLIDKFI